MGSVGTAKGSFVTMTDFNFSPATSTPAQKLSRPKSTAFLVFLKFISSSDLDALPWTIGIMPFLRSVLSRSSKVRCIVWAEVKSTKAAPPVRSRSFRIAELSPAVAES